MTMTTTELAQLRYLLELTWTGIADLHLELARQIRLADALELVLVRGLPGEVLAPGRGAILSGF